MNAAWSRRVLETFDASARRYDALATLQQAMALRLAEHCRRTDTVSYTHLTLPTIYSV